MAKHLDIDLTEPIIAPILQPFGTRRQLYRALGQLGHNGIDYAAEEGTEVTASAPGTVVHAGWSQNHPWLTHHAGIAVLINHGTHFTGYAHLSAINVAEGQPVEAGEVIGQVGHTGTAGSDHLHFEFLGNPPDFSNGYAGREEPTFTEPTEPETPGADNETEENHGTDD